MEIEKIFVGQHIDGYGTILAVAYKKPTPMSTWLDFLEKAKVVQSEIDTFYLTCENIDDTIEYLTKTSRDTSFKYVLRGYRSRAVPTDKISFIEDDEGYLEHKNLVKTKSGKYLLWHEPYHEKHEDEDYFGLQYEDDSNLNQENLNPKFAVRMVDPEQEYLEDVKSFYKI